MNPHAYVYRYFDVNGHLLYIGSSEDPARRLRDHVSNRSFDGLIATVTVTRYASRNAAEVAERVSIKAEKPIYNSQHNGGSLEVVTA